MQRYAKFSEQKLSENHLVIVLSALFQAKTTLFHDITVTKYPAPLFPLVGFFWCNIKISCNNMVVLVPIEISVHCQKWRNSTSYTRKLAPAGMTPIRLEAVHRGISSPFKEINEPENMTT